MTYTELKYKILYQANRIQNVNHVSGEDVYADWLKPNIKYSAVNIYLQSAQRQSNMITYNVLMYYGDRLLQDGSNRDSIIDDGIVVLQTIIDNLDDIIEYQPPVYQPFDQQFADYLAGVFCTVSFDCPYDPGSCGITPLKD